MVKRPLHGKIMVMSDISQNLDLRQSQNLVMTPQLQQAIKILQLNNMELNEFVEQELEQNPLLEKDDQPSDESDSDEKEAGPSEETDRLQDSFDEGWTGNENQERQTADVRDSTAMSSAGSGGNTSFDTLDQSFENSMSKDATLREHLIDQLHVSFTDTKDRLVGAQMIDLLDESGYLRSGTAELAEQLSASEERIDKIVTAIKTFDPAGIFASSLEECLAIQLDDQGRLDAPMKKLLDNLDLLANHDMAKLAKVCDVNETYLSDMVGEIRELNPKPAGDFDHFVMQTAIPDVLMKKLPKNLGGGWAVELNNATLPRVLVNEAYYTEVAQATKDKKDKSYLNSKLQSANWLVRAMDQRAKTILKVAGEIIEEQNAFFLFGVEYLKPMTLKDIAEKIDMHESTVSRVTNNKYIDTPRGIFELKYFFSTALGDGDDAHSDKMVKSRIKKLVDEEDPKKVLSDEKIAKLLQDEGIDIARRTVAKYREGLHIPSSVQRRKLKKNG